jgi:hypothetical protein
MTTIQRLDQRWRSEIEEVGHLASRSGGRLRVLLASTAHVEIELSCISAFRAGDGEPSIAHAMHRIALARPDGWPAVPVQAIHLHPPGIFHPNIAPAYAGGAPPADQVAAVQRLLGIFCAGAICYGGQATPATRLADVITQCHAMLGFRFVSAFSQQGEHLNVEAVRWAHEMLLRKRFPLEKRPLVGGYS